METSGLPADKCEVHKLILGGGFGRRGMTDYVRQAVSIAKQMPGTPIKLLWSREDDMQHGTYHPVTQCKLTGAFDKDNNLTALHVRISGQSILFTVRPAALVNGRTRRHSRASLLPATGRSDTVFRTCWSNIRCATPTSRRASGAASTSIRTRSISSVSSMNWRFRSAKIRSRSGAS